MILLRWLKHNERGMAAVLIALLMTALGGVAALSMDVGQMMVWQNRMKAATDAGALAAVQHLPDSVHLAEMAADQYATINHQRFSELMIAVEDNVVRVSGKMTVQLGLARLIGISVGEVQAESRATIGAVGAVAGCTPFGVEHMDFEFGDEYILKLSSDGESGNFRALSLGSTGASAYRYNLENGYEDRLAVGDVIDTEPGVMAGPTQQGIKHLLDADPGATYETVSAGSPRLLICPMVYTESYDGRTEVTVVGFAAFFLEGYGTYDGQFGVKGRFLRLIVDGEIDAAANDYGLKATRLLL